MSFLDMDEWLIELAKKADVVFSPLMDAKRYPDDVAVALVEGAVANEENLEMIHRVRERTRTVVSFGDCAVTGNVTSLRNPLGTALEVLRPVYLEHGDLHARIPEEKGVLPVLLDLVRPVHAVVDVDFYLPGCPPPAGRIRAVLEALLEGREPILEGNERRFG
jgi:NAD-reducing hydrogenase small subunit